jgi:phosphopantothenoylcysteine decarboxylase/phosphopantothenate--cysteine ligase
VKILLTAGPTREAIDPVRYLSNRSSGRMGYALAQEAAKRGHEVVLVSGPVHLSTPEGVTRVDVTTAEEMYQAVEANLEGVDVAIYSAAVADYRPAEVHAHKLKKGAAEWTLKLEKTRDILSSMRRPLGYEGCLVGFAAETENLIKSAHAKLESKGCDLVVANDVSRSDIGFDQKDNEVVLLYRDGREESLAKASKDALAAMILDRINDLVS